MTPGLVKVSGMETRGNFSLDMNLLVRMIQNWGKVVSFIGLGGGAIKEKLTFFPRVKVQGH